MNSSSTDQQAEALRAGLLGMWSSVSPGWADNADYIDSRCAPLTERMIASTAPQPGDRVLELACGPGGPGFEAAMLVGPSGEVVMSDFSPEMTAVAAQRAETRGLHAVETRVLDLENIDEADDSFDVAFCREGLMLVPDPDRAASEIRRVLRPGGRVALAVWGPRANNPWLSIVFDVVSEQFGAPLPPPGLPQPFSLDDADRLGEILRNAGFDEVEVSAVALPCKAGTADEWWQRTAALAGPLGNILAMQSPEVLRELRARADAEISRFAVGDGLDIPGESLLATARAGA